MHRKFVALGFEFSPHVGGDSILQIHVASGEREFREARGFKRSLNILVEVDDVRYELRVRLRLIPSAHNAEGDSNLIFLHECGDDGVQRTLVTCKRVR